MNKELLIAVKKLIIEAGQIALDTRENRLNVSWKEDGSPVTNADQEISQYIYDILSNITPSIPIICEERPLVPIDIKDKFWLIDPIDGTRSFIKNEDSFTVNIALIENQEPSYGFIYQPVTKILYFIDENKEFQIEQNGKILEKKSHNHDDFIAIVSSNNFNKLTSDYLKNNGLSKVIAMPSSLKLCMVAAGEADIYPKFGTTMEWDIAAGHALIKAAGGDIYLLDGELMSYGKDKFLNSNFIAANNNWLNKNS